MNKNNLKTKSNKNKYFSFLILIILLSFAARILFSFAFPVIWWDESVYSNLGMHLSKNPLDYSYENVGWSDYAPDGSWPKAGFRAPLLSYILAVFYFFKVDFLIIFFIPAVGTASVFLVYLISKKMFNEKAGLYSALFFSLLPLHVFYSGRILTDVLSTFFALLAILFFWKGYEENNKFSSIFFGFLFALAFLSRYTSIWLLPVFLFYFIIRDKSLAFLKNKNIWIAILVFFITLIPLFAYSTYVYDTPFGVLIHGSQSPTYWGGEQPWISYFEWWIDMFSIIGIFFLFSLFYFVYKKDIFKKPFILLILWIFFILFFAIITPHKEDRYVILISPAICILSGIFLDRIKPKLKTILIVAIIILTAFSVFSNFINSTKAYNEDSECFLETMNFLISVENNSLIITDNSAPVFYYTNMENHFFPNPWMIESIQIWKENEYKENTVYILFEERMDVKIKEELDKKTLRVFECSEDYSPYIVYKYA